MTDLLVPERVDTASLAAATKAVVAATLFGSNVKITLGDVPGPRLLLDGSEVEDTVEIVAHFIKITETEASHIDLIDKEISPFVKSSTKLDTAVSTKLAEQLPEAQSAAAVILFGDFHALVSARGKMAIAVEAPLVMWYQQILHNPRVKAAVATVAKCNYTKPEGRASFSRPKPSPAEHKETAPTNIEAQSATSARTQESTAAGNVPSGKGLAEATSEAVAAEETASKETPSKETASKETASKEAAPVKEVSSDSVTQQINTGIPKEVQQGAPDKGTAEKDDSSVENVSRKLADSNLATAAAGKADFPHVDPKVRLPIREHPVLPKKGERNYLVTSALPYVNNVPHLGNIIGSVLSADFYARYLKARGYNALYICGTDEYGTATETKAIEEKITPQALCNKYHDIHKQVYDWFQIGFDHFGRTSTAQQTEIAQDIFRKLDKNGYLEEQSMEQLYCTVHNGYLADRFVEGTCPKCGYEDARGDQCDKCGQLLDPFELISPRCKLDNSTPIKKETKHVFLELDKLQPQITEWYEKSSVDGNWSKNAKSITNNWLKEGLKPRAITRDLKWGTPVPRDGYESKVLYVWFDATIGYPSITATYTDKWAEWWHHPENVFLYQFMGKDNVPFHSVIFPGSALGTKDPWTLVHHLSTTEYLQYEGGKFSKSRNLGVFGNNAQEIGVGPSVWRYYLACARPETSDTQFSWQDFVTRNNSELLANFGNFVNRAIKFAIAKLDSTVPKFDTKALANFDEVVKEFNDILARYNEAMSDVQLREGLDIAMRLSARGNQFLQDNKVSNSLLEEEPEVCKAVIGVALNWIYILSAVFSPFMPETSTKIEEQLQVPPRLIPDTFDLAIEGGHKLGSAQHLFTRIDSAKVAEWQAKFGGDKTEKQESKSKKKKKSKAAKKESQGSTKEKESSGPGINEGSEESAKKSSQGSA